MIQCLQPMASLSIFVSRDSFCLSVAVFLCLCLSASICGSPCPRVCSSWWWWFCEVVWACGGSEVVCVWLIQDIFTIGNTWWKFDSVFQIVPRECLRQLNILSDGLAHRTRNRSVFHQRRVTMSATTRAFCRSDLVFRLFFIYR